MKKIFVPYLFFSAFLFVYATVNGQVNIVSGTQVYLHTGSSVVIKGDFTTGSNIAGPGKIILNGTAVQHCNTNGLALNNLAIDNAAGVELDADLIINNQLEFSQGKIKVNDHALIFGTAATISGQANGKFIETNGAGYVQKNIGSNLTDFQVPVGNGNAYNPLKINTTGTFNNAFVTIQSKDIAHPSKHIRSTDYLKHYWHISQSGITGTLNASGNYNDANSISGDENFLRGIFWNGTAWSLAGSNINTTTNEAGATIAGDGDLYAMNKFILSKPKMFLQGAYNVATSLMDDKLRNPGTYSPGNFPSGNLLPLNDPYRNTPLSASFTHINNPVAESIVNNVLNDQADAAKNIVDWVFLELRNNDLASPGANVVQTRTALLRRNGEIVDVDGISPVYFKNIDANNNYTLVVRHRNHIGIATDPVANLQTIDLSGNSATDFTVMNDAQLFGNNVAFAVNTGKTLLWAGNINANNNIRYNGPANDRDYLLSTILSGNQGTILTDVYSIGDINMNRVVRYNGPANDRDYLLATPLTNNQGTIRTESLPQ